MCKIIRIDNEIIIYDKRIFNVPCICFYGLESDKNIYIIPKVFFDGFANFNLSIKFDEKSSKKYICNDDILFDYDEN